MNSSLYLLKEAQVGLSLKLQMTEWRIEGLSFDQIAEKLSETGPPVHGSTVVRWAREKGVV